MMPPKAGRKEARQEVPIERIGFFHYGSDNKEDPIGSLREALLLAIAASDPKNVRDCLIGLPEAFNIRRGYWNANRALDPSISKSLKEVCEEFGAAFVVGLVEQPALLSPHYSSAYLIDGTTRELLSRKMEEDRSCNYQPCIQNFDQPFVYRGICVAALICMDADFKKNRVSDRHKALLARMTATGTDQPILFVPSHMTVYLSEEIAKAWPPHVITVLANSAPSQPSAIRLRELLIRIRPHENIQNVLYLTPFR